MCHAVYPVAIAIIRHLPPCVHGDSEHPPGIACSSWHLPAFTSYRSIVSHPSTINATHNAPDRMVDCVPWHNSAGTGPQDKDIVFKSSMLVPIDQIKPWQ